MYIFNKAAELLEKTKKHRLPISEIAIRHEMEYSQKTRDDVVLKMRKMKKVMEAAVKRGIKSTKKSLSGMSGGDANKVYGKVGSKNLLNPLALKAMAYAIATNEENARMGQIVAYPTAGASGVVPGVVFSYAESVKASEEMILKGLFTGAAIGLIIAEGATLSAAEGGCQAEVGAATAMAAAGVTEMRKGTPEQCLVAATLALKDMLGLTCDPIAGLVEVPCVQRNATGAVHALASSDLAMAGVTSFVPFDEVVEAMMETAKLMSPRLRETGLGGLATTKTGLKVKEKLIKESKK